MTDDELGRVLYETGGEVVLLDEYGDGDYQPASWDDLPETEAIDQGENCWLPPKEQFREMARALRVALCPSVEPLAPGCWRMTMPNTDVLGWVASPSVLPVRALAMKITHHSTGEAHWWLAIERGSGNGYEDVRLDRAGWLALRDLCTQVVATMDEDTQDAPGSPTSDETGLQDVF